MKDRDVRRVCCYAFVLFLAGLHGRMQARGPVTPPRFDPKDLSLPRPTASLPDEVANAIKELDTPENGGIFSIHINQPPFPTKTYLPCDFYEPCRDAIDLLIKTKAPIDGELLELARSSDGLRIRYRAIHILAMRGTRSVIPLVNKMCASSDDKERYLGWNTYEVAAREKRLPAPIDAAQHLKLYAQEKDSEVRQRIEWFFGTAKTRAAVKPLLRTLRADPAAYYAVDALGKIGDKDAVPGIIKASDSNGHKSGYLPALGALATSEAVDFIIKHLDEYGAAEALTDTRSQKALPALRAHLEKLNQRKTDNDSIPVAATRVAIIRLSHPDPREALLRLAEDQREGRRVRWDGLDALRRKHDPTRFHERILNIYKGDKDGDVKRICIWILEDSSYPGVTDAMIEHALAYDAEQEEDASGSTARFLCSALNKRMGTTVPDLKAMQKHLRSVRMKEKQME